MRISASVSTCVAAIALATAGATGCSSSAGSAPADAGSGAITPQGCNAGRLATAYVAGSASATSSTPSDAAVAELVPCFTLTGQGAAESSIGIARDGTVFFAPAFGTGGNGIVRSQDEGATWEPRIPTFPNGQGHGRTQPYMYLDPATDHLFFLTTAASASTGFDLSLSTDEGMTWVDQTVVPEAQDWAKIYGGPPVTSKPQGVPDILYITAPSPISTPFPAGLGPTPAYQAVYSSLDGGQTWQNTGATSLSLKPADVPGCAPNEWVIYGSGVVGSDGTIYLGLRRCAHLGISISHDEGHTWTTSDVPGTVLPPFDTTMLLTLNGHENILVGEPFALDEAGNLYALWDDAENVLRLSVSRDHAATWSAPVAVSAPSLMTLRYGAIATKGTGTIAIAYYGSVDGTKYDAYMAESTDSLDPQPVFTSVTANDPAAPLFSKGFDSGYQRVLGGGDLVEFVQVKYAPSGDIWASFVKEMCPAGNTSACTWDYAAHAKSIYQGAVGRLVHGS
jgi:hypothetical protein